MAVPGNWIAAQNPAASHATAKEERLFMVQSI
jgi:hypothetical protein